MKKTGGHVFYEEEWMEEEEEIPEELESCADQVEETFVNYLDSRKRMKELALARGFYPVMAIQPEFTENSNGGKSDSERKRGKGKGKQNKGKGKGKSSGFRRIPFNRRPNSGLRKPFNASASTNATDIKSTLSGSTSSHGPRFKRYRLQSNGVKEVPEEQISMVLEEDPYDMTIMEAEIHFVHLSSPGLAIMNSGATRTIVGEISWKQWLEHYGSDSTKPVVVIPMVRSFKFGGGETLTSQYDVIFPAIIQNQVLELTTSILPGNILFLLARPTLEA